MLTTARPTSAITTVMPANTTALPAVPVAWATDSRSVHAVAEVLLVAGEDEQRVVDADGQAEHRGQDRGGLGELDHAGERGQAGDADRRRRTRR